MTAEPEITAAPPPPRPGRRAELGRVLRRALGKAWDDDIFSHSAQAAFWQALSLPPLFLGLLGALGFVGGWFGQETVHAVEDGIIGFAHRVFTAEVVDQIIAPTAQSILTTGRADVVSVGFVVSLWAGSSAVASIIDSITDAHGQKLVRHPIWQRIFSLLVYLVALVIAVLTLPIIALGPDLLPDVLPASWRPAAQQALAAFYYPGTGLLLVVVLTTLYKVALPQRLPWRRLLPGALLAMLVFIASTTGLRIYIAVLISTGYTYGALATPIAFLLFAFLLGLSIVFGAQLNNAIQEVWPAPAQRPRRLPRLLPARAADVSPDRPPDAPHEQPSAAAPAAHAGSEPTAGAKEAR